MADEDQTLGAIEETPEQSYYPGARCTFVVRFDDPKRKRFNRNPLTLPVTRLKNKFPQVLDIVEEDGKLVLVPKGAQAKPSSLRPSALAIGGDALTQEIGGIIPLRASLSLNGIRTASTLTLEIAFRDLPIEPRMVRGVGVDFYLGTVTASEYARGIAGETRDVGYLAEEPLNLIPTTYVDGFGRSRTNLRFSGWVDEWEVSWSESEPIVRLQCRDNGAILLDTEAPPMLALDATIPLDRAIAKYLTVFPQFAGISVQYLPRGVQAPTYKAASQKAAYKVPFGPPSITGGGKATVLDYLSDIAAHLGLVVRFDAMTSTVIVQQPRTIYGNKFPKRDDDPFGRTTGLGRSLPFRLFVWGRNVAECTMKRKFTVAGPTTIEVRSYSSTLKRYLVERYPVKKDRLERGLPGGLLPDEKIQQFFFPGVKDAPTLRAIAQGIYEQLGRNELELFVRTKDLGSFGGSALDPDLLDCKVGDTIQFEVTDDASTADANTINEVEAKQTTASKAAEFMRSLGYSDDFAQAYGKARENALMQPYFRVKRLELSWDVEKGIDIGVQAVNYIEVRADSLPKGEEIEPTQTSEEVRQRLINDAKAIGAILRGGGTT